MTNATMVTRGWLAAGIAAATLGFVASCGNGDILKNTITEAEATQRVEDYVRQTMAALRPEARLEVLAPADSLICDDPTDHGPENRVTVGNIYWVRGLPVENNNQHFDAVLDWWRAHDFAVRADDRRPGSNYVLVENRKDGFRMAFRDNFSGGLLLGADSPCVAPRHAGTASAVTDRAVRVGGMATDPHSSPPRANAGSRHHPHARRAVRQWRD